jgi:hypothetical protein
VAAAQDQLIDKLWQQIEFRTWRRVRDLNIQIEDGQIVVRGTAPTYYVKQLALRAICDVAAATPLSIRIDVEQDVPPLHLYEVMAG